MRGKLRAPAIAALALALVAAACGGSTDPGQNGGLTGEIFVSGSSTVEPITALAAELFNEENPDVAINVEGPGTGDGFELFCAGETDISDASRPIKDEEAAVCDEAGIEYVELEVALDGISVLTSPENDAVECLNFGDLYALLGPESEDFANWRDAEDLARELDGKGGYPDLPLEITAPGEESGTYDAFVELALLDVAEARLEDGKIEEDQAETTRADYQASGNDNVIIEGIAGSKGSLGWVGFSFFEQNQDVVRAIAIDGGDGCVEPTLETIADGSYPISRSLYIYVNKQKAAENEALKAFVDFYVTDDGLKTAVEEVAYVPLPDDRIEATRSAWEAGVA